MARSPSRKTKTPRSPSHARKRAESGKETRLSSRMEELTRSPSKPTDQAIFFKTEAQERYYDSIRRNTLTFGVGPAGTGKTYIATRAAADALMEGECDLILFTRPVVEAGERLGFLPGEEKDKIAPWFAPILIELNKILGKSQVEALMKSERIKFMPLAFMRGHSFNQAYVVLDEAQNTTPEQMELLLTRTGEDTKVIVDGCLRQKDVQGKSGLYDALKKLTGKASVGRVDFQIDDIVRSGFVRDVLLAYNE